MPPIQELELEPASPLDNKPSSTAELLKQISEPLQDKHDLRRSGAVARDLAIAIAVTLALRLPYFRGRMFPLNDGGMFAQIIDDIRASHFVLPTHTPYNFLDIPLSYPPLAFYLGAFCTVLTGQSTVSVLTWLPLLLNIGTVITIYFIASEIYPSSFYACLSACCYASIGRSGEWLTMGGGLTRGCGILFAVLAILFFLRSRNHKPIKFAAWSGVFVGLAIASHLEGGIFAAFSLVLLTTLLSNRRQNIRSLILAGAVSVIVILPWIIWLYRHLGFQPLIDAAHTGGGYALPRNPLSLALLVSSTVLAVVGRFPYIFWLPLTSLVMRRSGSTYGAVVGGLCMVWFANAIMVVITRRGAWLRRWKQVLLVVIATTLALLNNGLPTVKRDRLADLHSNTRSQVSVPEILGMEAAARLTPPNAKFFVFSQRFTDWPIDMVAEWFPYFAQRQCVDTVQGREWLPNKEFLNATEANSGLELSSPEVDLKVLAKFQPDYVFIAGPFDEDQKVIANTVRSYAGSSPIYENAEVEIYKVRPR